MKESAKITHLESEDEIRARNYYYKLWKCLKMALAHEELGCHCNNIVVHLGKSVESGFKYYDAHHDAWCDYFLSSTKKFEKED